MTPWWSQWIRTLHPLHPQLQSQPDQHRSRAPHSTRPLGAGRHRPANDTGAAVAALAQPARAYRCAQAGVRCGESGGAPTSGTRSSGFRGWLDGTGPPPRRFCIWGVHLDHQTWGCQRHHLGVPVPSLFLQLCKKKTCTVATEVVPGVGSRSAMTPGDMQGVNTTHLALPMCALSGDQSKWVVQGDPSQEAALWVGRSDQRLLCYSVRGASRARPMP